MLSDTLCDNFFSALSIGDRISVADRSPLEVVLHFSQIAIEIPWSNLLLPSGLWYPDNPHPDSCAMKEESNHGESAVALQGA